MQRLSEIDVVILCGGLGTRIQPTIGVKQKTMADVAGRPFLDIVLKHLSRQGLRRIILCVGYQAEDVKNYYKKNPFGLKIVFSCETESLGTGGAIKNTKEKVLSDVFFALNGDCFCALDYRQFLKFHVAKKSRVSLVVSLLEKGKDFGSIVLDKNDEIISFQEKLADAQRRSLYVSTGIYCFNRDIFSLMPKEKKFSIEKDFFPGMTGKNFFGFRTEKKFIDIGTPERYKIAQDLFKEME